MKKMVVDRIGNSSQLKTLSFILYKRSINACSQCVASLTSESIASKYLMNALKKKKMKTDSKYIQSVLIEEGKIPIGYPKES